MRKISIKIILAIALCSTILAAVIGTISISTFSKKLTEKSDSNLVLMSENAAKQMDIKFNVIRKTVDNMAIVAGNNFDATKAKEDKNYIKKYFLSLRNFVKEISSSSDNNLDGYILLDSSYAKTAYVDELIYIKNSKGQFEYVPLLNSIEKLQTNPKKYDWYFMPMQQKKGLWTDVYLDVALKMQMISYVAPVKSNKVIVGMAGMDITFDGLKKIVQQIKPYKGSYAFLVNDKNSFVVHPKYKLTDNLNSVESKHYKKLTQQFDRKSSGFIRIGDEEISYAKLSNNFKLCVVVPKNEIMSEVTRLKKIIVLVIIFGVLLAIIIAAILGTKIANPIKVLIDNMSIVEDGELDLAIFTNNKDEIGLVYDKFNTMVNSLKIAKEEIEVYILARDQAEQAMEISEERYRLATDGANDIIWDWDILSDGFYVSKVWGDLGETVSHVTKLSLSDFISMIHSEDRNRAEDEIKNYINGQKEYYTSEYRFVLQDRSVKWGLIKGKGLKNDKGEVLRMAGSLTDITERKLYEKRIEELAFKDQLTGLPNRASLYDKLRHISLKDVQKMLTAVFHVDIDNFNIINDLYGHRFGDSVILSIAKELMDVSETEWFLSRSGGDEFTIIIDNIESSLEISNYAKRMQKCINKNITVFNQNLDMTCSIGIYIYPEFSVSADEIFKNVDLAMYKAKKEGKNRFVYFDNWMNDEIVKKVEFEHRLKEAINNNEFVLHYQPQFNLLTDQFYGFEALIRWNSPVYGMVSPLKFIPVAEETGLIVPIGLWVLRTAAAFAEKLHELNTKDVKISINVSAVQLLQADFVESFVNGLKGFEAQIGNLSIEITESSMIENFETNTEKLLELKKLGFTVSLDDFGTGYSSLNYLNKLPIDVVKLDKSFIDNIEIEMKKIKLTTFIIGLAHSMGLKVVAEGIESEHQSEILKSNGCDIAQGYLISKPIPEQEALNYWKDLSSRTTI